MLAGCKVHDSSIWWWILRPKKKAMGFGKLLTAFADQAGGWDFLGNVSSEFAMRSCTSIGGYDFWTNSITWFTHLHIICFLFPLCCRTLGPSFQEQFNLLLNTAPKRRSWRFSYTWVKWSQGHLMAIVTRPAWSCANIMQQLVVTVR